MTRNSELLRSKWPEFDLDAAKWDIPAERMKMGKPHRVFLSRQAVEILRQVHELTGHTEYVFPSIFRGSVPMGDVTLNHFFKRIEFGVPDFSPHWTRGTAATMLREHGFGRDVVELLLAHNEKNATVAAYSHMELAADRKRALQYLTDRVEALAAGMKSSPPLTRRFAHPFAHRPWNYLPRTDMCRTFPAGRHPWPLKTPPKPPETPGSKPACPRRRRACSSKRQRFPAAR